jgi:hypothetical protein
MESESETVVIKPIENQEIQSVRDLEHNDMNDSQVLAQESISLPVHPAIKNGLYFDWYDNGDKKGETTYEGGVKSGLSKRWYLNGQIKQECSFMADRYHGLYQSWYENGNLRVQGNYLKGKQDGEWILYGKGGEKMPSIYYENGIEVTRKLKAVRR